MTSKFPLAWLTYLNSQALPSCGFLPTPRGSPVATTQGQRKVKDCFLAQLPPASDQPEHPGTTSPRMAWSRATGAAAQAGEDWEPWRPLPFPPPLLSAGVRRGPSAPCPWVPRAWGAGKVGPSGRTRLLWKAEFKGRLRLRPVSLSSRSCPAHQARLPGRLPSTWDGPYHPFSSLK